jgi:hypothetical protein
MEVNQADKERLILMQIVGAYHNSFLEVTDDDRFCIGMATVAPPQQAVTVEGGQQ